MASATFPVLVKKTILVDESTGKQYMKSDSKSAKESKMSVQAMVDGKLVWTEPLKMGDAAAL